MCLSEPKVRITTRPGSPTCCAKLNAKFCRDVNEKTTGGQSRRASSLRLALAPVRLWSWNLGMAPRALFVEVKSERDNLARRLEC